MTESHYTAVLCIKKVEHISTGTISNKKVVHEIVNFTIRGTKLDSIQKRLQSHIELVSEDG